MPGRTQNADGKIIVSAKAIAKVANHYSLECYGVVNLVPKDAFQSIKNLFFKNDFTKGIKVRAENNRINIDVFVILKFGLSISAVAKNLKDTIKFNVEDFTGMIVDCVNVHVKGIRV